MRSDQLASPAQPGTLSPRQLAEAIQHLGGEPDAATRIIETHISWVILSGNYAFKFKKPISLPFLNYSSADRRRFFCQEELRLNRRFAPDLYLDVVSVEGEPAVRMRRFAEENRLDHRCELGKITIEQLSRLARTIIAFHAASAVAGPETRFGEPDQVWAPMHENLAELNRLLPSEKPRLAPLADWTAEEFARRQDSWRQRKRSGKIRECHGDLHLGNLVLINDEAIPFDCIEFNEDLRWIDVASEIAFLYTDLLKHARPDLASWLINAWLTESGDFALLAVLRFYSVYRALVRAKVAAISRDTAKATQYIALAEHLITPTSPRLTITYGLAGSGKTTASAARILADRRAQTIRLRSDVERKRLHGLSASDTSRSRVAGGIYSAQASAQTYLRLEDLADEALGSGWSVIIDAAFLKRTDRERFRQLAFRHGLPYSILACTAPIETLRERLRQRLGDASEATLDVLDWQQRHIDPLTAEEQRFVITN